jgi:hypothetical protein
MLKQKRTLLFAVAGSVLLLTGTLFADQRSDWTSTATNPEIQYRVQVFDNARACYLEFRDQKQGPGYTTFDAAVDYKSTDLDPDGHPTVKTDSEHIVTGRTNNGNSRISNCFAVVSVRVSLVQRL